MTASPLSLELDQLNAVFQPIVSLRNGSILGYEGLIRGAKGSSRQSPEQLFESARDTEDLRLIEIASIRTVLLAFGELHLAGKLFLNVAPAVLHSTERPLQRMEGFLQLAGLSASQIVIEVTENQPSLGDHSIYQVLRQARGLGFEVAIDDLGEGYASLRVWSELQPEYVKIDKHFVHGLYADPVKFQFVRTIRQLSQAVGTKVIGEGVEHESELHVLRDLGVEYAQGFLLSAPVATPQTQVRSEVHRLIRAPRADQTDAPVRLSPGQLRMEQITTAVEPISPNASLREAQNRFEAAPELIALPVVAKRIAIGLLRREIAFLPKRVGRGEREPPLVRSIMDAQPLTVDCHMSLEEVSVLLAQTDWHHFAKPLVVTERGMYRGVATAQQVLREFSRFQTRALRYAHPLTSLPGQVPIQEALQNLLERKLGFVAVQCDIDHLKAYNEVFGYPRGDNLIKYAAIVVEAYCDQRLDFLGHLEGGTFVILIRSSDWQERCQMLVDQFNLGRHAFLAQTDLSLAGYYQPDRQGNPQFRALPSLSVGAVVVGAGPFASYHEVLEAIKTATKEAKKVSGGSLFVERRQPSHRFRVGFDPEKS